MKKILIILICFVFFNMSLTVAVGSEKIDGILAEVDGKIIKLSDVEMEKKFIEEAILPPIFENNKSVSDSFIDEGVLSSIGIRGFEKNLLSLNRNFGLYAEKREEWLRGMNGEFNDVLYVWSGRIDEFFQEVVTLGKMNEEDGLDLSEIIKSWRDQILVDLFFPNESRCFRKKDVDSLIKITAETFGVDSRYIEKRFLKRAFAKIAFDEIQEEATAKAQVVPADIRQYCENYPIECYDVFYKKVKNKELSEWLVSRLADGGFQKAGISDFEVLNSAVSLLTEAREKIIRGEYNFWLEIGGNFYVFRAEKLSFAAIQDKLFEKIKETKKSEFISQEILKLRKKSVILIK